ncbi:RecF/RecN/SMC [Globomyces pollinis-pini]|nr:RecF/RecN/SMC [Globomyces pollinis-pini]
MILINFKSYYGQIQIGPFHKSFTSVVGPNGSGKSNVIDALLFVFGFKAKKLRQGKLSDLIHNSTSHPDVSYCTVQLFFEEIIDKMVPFYLLNHLGGKSESSTYQVDGKNKTYSEVQTLLKGFGVDLDHKRFLILQGEVESIALMKPKGANENEDGLLEYLEDIIGTTSFKQPIEETTKVLDSLNDTYEQELMKFKHIKKETDALKQKSQEAINYIQHENQVTRLVDQIIQLECFHSNNAIEKITEDLAETDEIARLETEMTTFKDSHKARSYISYFLVATRKNQFGQEMECKTTEKHLSDKRKKLSKTLQQVVSMVANVKDKLTRSEDLTWVNNFENDVARNQAEMDSLKVQLVEDENILQEMQKNLQGKTQTIQCEIEQKQKEVAPYLEKLYQSQAEYDVLKSEFDIFDQKVNGGKKALEDSIQLLAEMQTKSKIIKDDMDENSSRLNELTEDQAHKSNQTEKTEHKIAVAKENFMNLRRKLDDSKAFAESSKTRGRVHAQLMNQKKLGVIKGICGRLGDLGTIDKKYDVAITTSCSALDSIIVETVGAAQECIEYLKKNDIGRATFLCLDRLKNHDMRQIQTPENVPRLFDLIKPVDARYAPAFYQAVFDTLVATDLNQANRVAYGKTRFRVVTLDGKVIDKSGTMTGGGQRVQRGGMDSRQKSDVSPQEVEQLEIEVQQAKDRWDELVQRLNEIQSIMKESAVEIKSLTLTVTKAKMELASLNDQITDAEQAVALAKENSVPKADDINRFKELKKLLAECESSVAKHKSAAKLIEDEIKELQEKVMEIGGIRLRSQSAKVQSLKDQIESLQIKITKLKSEKTFREKNLIKLDETIEKKTIELKEVERELEDIQKTYEQLLKNYHLVKERVKECEEELESHNDELTKMKENLKQKTSLMNEIRQAALQKNRQSLQLKLQLTGFEDTEQTLELKKYSKKELEEFNLKSLRTKLETLKNNNQVKQPNLGVLKEYKTKMEVCRQRSQTVEEASKARDEAKVKLETFMTGFNAISLKLKEMYQMITMGGNAELELVDSLDPFSEGSWKNIANLSGGEKTLSSLALVFALHHFKPTPLYVMDEIDAALDFRNVSIVANYIKERTKNAQFIIISLRNNMFELADRLVGVYKTDNTSKSITINPTDVELQAHA